MIDRYRAAGDQVALTASLVTAGAAVASAVRLPGWQAEVNVLGSPLGVGLAGTWLLAALLVVLCITGVEGLVRTAPGLADAERRYTATFWILPGLVALATASAVPSQYGNRLAWLLILGLLGGLLTAVLAAEFGTAVEDGPFYRTSRLVLNIAVFGAAFALYASIYGRQLRGLLSAPAVMAVTFLLAVELLRSTEERLESTWLYAGILAFLMGEIVWALNWLGIGALSGGAVLLLFFYFFGGVSQQHLSGRLTAPIMVEFVSITLIGLLAVWLSLSA
jgi:hypothetical protein